MAAVLSLLLSSCGKEDVYHQDDADGAARPVLSLQVNVAAYHSSVGTRASDAESTTTFTNGDRLGVIVTQPDGSVEHIVYTYNGSSWSSTSQAYYDSKNSYAAYFPYRDELEGQSLAQVRAGFTPLTDQSDYATGYAASDLMTCESATQNQTDKKLQINLTHAFSMLRFPVSEALSVKSKCGDGNTYKYQAKATDIVFHIGDTPYRAWIDNNGYARVIVSSNSSTVVKSNYTVSGKRVEISNTFETLASGQYYTVTPPVADLGEYKLSDACVGDFYCKSSDGQSAFVVPKEVTGFSDDLKSQILGIVLKAGKDGIGDWKDDCQYKLKGTITEMSKINGYVLALYDANDGSTCTWGPIALVNHNDMNREYIGFYGYKNTQAIISFNNEESTLQTKYPATYYATKDYETRDNGKYAAPANSSGWFLPSTGQCRYWLNNKDVLLKSMQKAGGDGWYNYYWSSSEYSDDSMYYARTVTNGSMIQDRKDTSSKYRVRSCLAF